MLVIEKVNDRPIKKTLVKTKIFIMQETWIDVKEALQKQTSQTLASYAATPWALGGAFVLQNFAICLCPCQWQRVSLDNVKSHQEAQRWQIQRFCVLHDRGLNTHVYLNKQKTKNKYTCVFNLRLVVLTCETSTGRKQC